MYQVHKWTWNKSEVPFYYFFKFQVLVFLTEYFQMYYTPAFLFSTSLVPNYYVYVTFPVHLRFIYGSFWWTGEIWQKDSVYLSQPV